MADFHFLRPFWLLAFLPVVVIWWGFLRNRDERTRWATFIDAHLLDYLLVSPKNRNRLRPIHFLAVMLTLSIIALAGPSYRMQPSPFLDEEAGLMVLLKVGPTMSSEDVQPSRLARAKQKIRDLLDIRAGNSTGLIVYSGSAHLVMPLTRDTRIINTMIEDLTPELMPKEGDVLGSGLLLAGQLLEQTGLPGSILVIADTVAVGQKSSGYPVQFLSMLPPGSPVDFGMQQLASATGTSITELAVDASDVERIARKAKSSLASVHQKEQGQQWRDEGYFLLPVLALGCLFWFRKGWVIR